MQLQNDSMTALSSLSAADDRVVIAPAEAVRREVAQVGRDEADPRTDACRRCPRRRQLDRLGRELDADNLARRPHDLGQQQRDVTGAAADVEHAHAARDARRPQQLAQGRPVEAVLQHQPPRLVV
jgi:hypothetical protein